MPLCAVMVFVQLPYVGRENCFYKVHGIRLPWL